MSIVSAEDWVVDSTPLIVLAKIDYLHLLTLFADQLLIPQIVADEVQAGDENDPARKALTSGFGQSFLSPTIPPQVAAYCLDPGEEAVLAGALARPGSRAVLDDGKGRLAAQGLNIPLIGTLGIIVRARMANHIPAAKPLIMALRQVDFRADDTLIRSVLQRLGETWP
ncbi:MAG: DUF3368 domain-containing protein [Armatimonadota bacterium]|nr:DUF3368 domain-containing protein [Armatimonadota bacterium]